MNTSWMSSVHDMLIEKPADLSDTGREAWTRIQGLRWASQRLRNEACAMLIDAERGLLTWPADYIKIWNHDDKKTTLFGTSIYCVAAAELITHAERVLGQRLAFSRWYMYQHIGLPEFPETPRTLSPGFGDYRFVIGHTSVMINRDDHAHSKSARPDMTGADVARHWATQRQLIAALGALLGLDTRNRLSQVHDTDAYPTFFNVVLYWAANMGGIDDRLAELMEGMDLDWYLWTGPISIKLGITSDKDMPFPSYAVCPDGRHYQNDLKTACCHRESCRGELQAAMTYWQVNGTWPPDYRPGHVRAETEGRDLDARLEGIIWDYHEKHGKWPYGVDWRGEMGVYPRSSDYAPPPAFTGHSARLRRLRIWLSDNYKTMFGVAVAGAVASCLAMA
ncbi:hypothetical protein Micbo1qcDRAFT_176546 [Microdochium bolleyi]|uniref:Uncharacterized protein n=1 Tax=Microdochium bolleyi TaxID=196109 RepID=A0A136IYJ0_9PEZI|nr:hypothetical protein Micbo1qcDRAFT_176546 [Microdochium bolleyi]